MVRIFGIVAGLGLLLVSGWLAFAPGSPIHSVTIAPFITTISPEVVWSQTPIMSPQITLQASKDTSVFPYTVISSNFTAPALLSLPESIGHLETVAYHPGIPAAQPLKPGQQYLPIFDAAVYHDGNREVTGNDLWGRILTVEQIDSQRITFQTDDRRELWRELPTNQLTGLAQVGSDPELTTLKHTFEGQRVWGYGGFSGECRSSAKASLLVRTSFQTPVKVKRVLRLSTQLYLNAQGQFAAGGAPDGADVLALTPLVFLLESEPFQADSLRDAGSRGQCHAPVPIFLADSWAVNRVLSLKPPPENLPSKRPEDPRGLTRQEYAWIAGFPDDSFGTKVELLRARVWRYRHFPSSGAITFDAQGKVSKFDWPRLP